MAVLNYDDYNDSVIYYPYQDDYWSPNDTDGNSTVTINYQWTMTCPHCQGWLLDYIGFHYCPYCGKELFPVKDIKPEILERLDKMLEEIKEIKEELEKE